MIGYGFGRRVTPMEDGLTEEKILELIRIVGTNEYYPVRHVPAERVNEILCLLRPDAPCTVIIEPCTVRPKENFSLHFENHGVSA